MRALVVMLALTLALPASAEEWPHPALGPSTSGGPEVLFTFDDGPQQHNTPKILETLERHGVRAIFFVAGWRLQPQRKAGKQRREVARQLLTAGQLLGNHTVNHVQLCQVSKEEGALEIDDNARMLAELVQMPVTFFRVPYGSRCKKVDALLAERGLQHLHWDIDAQEYWSASSDEAALAIIERLRALQGRAVILLHDTHRITTRTLPAILDWIEQENAARTAQGQKPIRILSYADIAREQLAPGVAPLLEQLGRAGRSFVPEVTRELIAPLCGTLPRHAAQL